MRRLAGMSTALKVSLVAAVIAAVALALVLTTDSSLHVAPLGGTTSACSYTWPDGQVASCSDPSKLTGQVVAAPGHATWTLTADDANYNSACAQAWLAGQVQFCPTTRGIWMGPDGPNGPTWTKTTPGP